MLCSFQVVERLLEADTSLSTIQVAINNIICIALCYVKYAITYKTLHRVTLRYVTLRYIAIQTLYC